jgi:hypothetical protein
MDGGIAIPDTNTQSCDLDPIRALCDGEVNRHMEGNRNYIHMRKLNLLVGNVAQTQDGLLCLNHGNPTYPTKLYLDRRIDTPTALNWNETAYILARTWHSWSWRDVQPGQLPIAILAAHLKAFQ